ncbi:HelD family protein [Streptomyces spiramenti]|uniref:AAA family ATPase n=1 Tax=Streptomyces spiramenti TaxID=2720606 RepID=A0ABX1ASR9_9ACTN|nr:ATP-binding domain-containing protein [Streptomyces spiramenti]NJP68646.1 AAA family ATPase [Streptomyces spiramenti]
MSTTTRADVLAGEQRAVDHAYACYDERLAAMSGSSAAKASATGKDGIANRVDAEARALAYGGLGDEALVYARVDAPEEPGDEPRPWYIGRRGVQDAENDPVVLLWTSPLAKRWMEALPDAPGDVSLRRQLRCVQRVLESYFDEIVPVERTFVQPDVPVPRGAAEDTRSSAPADSVPPAEPVEAPPGRPAVPAPDRAAPEAGQAAGDPHPKRAPSPGDIVRRQRRKPLQPDDFLLRELQRSRGGRMRDIVETIRRDQMDLVTGAPSDILVIQGGPGTGKSAVGLHRVTWLVNNDHFKAVDILVIGPHQRFLDYVGRVLPTLGTRDVNAVQLGRLWDGEVSGTDSPRTRLVKSDERMAAVLRRRVEHDHRPEALDDLTAEPAFAGDEPAVVITAGSTTLRVPRSEVLDLLTQVREIDAPYRERRDRFRGLLVDRLLQELSDVAPRRSQTGTIRRDLERNRRVERLVDRVWASPGPREALRSLYDSSELLAECAEGILDEDEQQALRRARAATADADRWTLDDHVCLEELRALITGETPRRYGHIVIDEAQDLTPMQARALRRRCAAGGSMTVLGDLAQATGPHTPTSWDRIGVALSDQGDWRVAELTRSYRVPAEIMEFVAPLARVVAPTLSSPLAVREAGPEAVRTVATEPWKLLQDTVDHVAQLSGTSDGSTLRSIAVVVPDDLDWLDEISRRIDESGAVAELGRQHVSVLAASQAKGLEYDHVLVVEPATLADRGPSGLRQLYVALTRSTQTLTVLHTAPLPPELAPTSDEEDHAESDGRSGDEQTPELPRIGTDVRVEVVDRAPGGRYKVRALAPGVERSLVLTVRHGSVPPRRGEELDCWVIANESNQTVLTADRRGRSPVSERMAERYVAALGVLDELVENDGKAPDARARLSELQGMANRVLRRDQADWVDVLHLFGDPARDSVTVLRDLAAGAGRALKEGALDHRALERDVASSGWAGPLAAAGEELRKRWPDRRSAHDDMPAADRRQPERKEDTVTDHEGTISGAPAAPPAPESFIRRLEEEAAADRGCRKHEAVRYALKSSLYWADLQPEDSPVVDVSCVADSGLLLYEAMGAGRSRYADLRAGATRLLEVNRTLAASAQGLYLVLPEPPSESWAPDLVREIFGVHVVWHTPEGWGGRELGALVGRSG